MVYGGHSGYCNKNRLISGKSSNKENSYRVTTITQEEMIEAGSTVGEVDAVRCGKMVKIL